LANPFNVLRPPSSAASGPVDEVVVAVRGDAEKMAD
jgi:hypothetical protein